MQIDGIRDAKLYTSFMGWQTAVAVNFLINCFDD